MNEKVPSSSELLTNAWASTSGESMLARLTRMSLEVSAAGRPELADTLRVLKTGRRTELDLHLEGAGVRQHETDAHDFGRFVTRTAVAVKEVIKSKTGRQAFPTNLQVLAPSMGSVRVVFRSPPPVTDGSDDDKLANTDPDSVEGDALQTVVQLISMAEQSDADVSNLEGSLHRLNGGARTAIRLMAQAVVDGKWSIAGELRRGTGAVAGVVLSEGGAQRLAVAANVTEDDVSLNNAMIGVVDGWTWSDSQMAFIANGGDSFKAVVPEELRATVAHLVDNQNPARGVFTIYTQYPPGDELSVRRSYELTGIEEIAQVSLDDTPDPPLDPGVE